MRIASNKLQDLIDFYFTELQHLYSKDEINLLVQFACRHYLKFSPAEITLKKKENINQSDVIKLYDCCLALKNNQPIQYILGETEFYKLNFKLNQYVLIPRPETEELVELIINDCHKRDLETVDILDIGTGSGCIPITLKKNLEDANVSALDVSHKALEIAQKNAILNNATVIFNQTDILSSDAEYSLDTYDVIVSNPPYIAKKEAAGMHTRVKNNEPALALFVEDDDAMIFYKRIIALCQKHLNAGGELYFELNPLFAEKIKTLALQSKLFSEVNVLKDLSGNLRFLKAVKHD